MLTNREIAVLAWLTFGLVWAMTQPKIRISLGRVALAALTPKIAAPVTVFVLYIGGLVFAASRAGIWDPSLTKDTVIWFVVAGLALFGHFLHVTEDRFLRRRILATIAVPAPLTGRVPGYPRPGTEGALKSADWKRAVQPVLGGGWQLSKKLAYRIPIGWVLYGLLAEDSPTRSPGFYLWRVRLPLVVPTDVVDLNWSDRVGGPSHVYMPGDARTESALRAAAVEISEEAKANSPVLTPPGGTDNLRMQEARGYGLVIEGNMRGALEVLERVMRHQARYPWERDIVKRAGLVHSLVAHDQISDAHSRLSIWRQGSIASLGLEAD